MGISCLIEMLNFIVNSHLGASRSVDVAKIVVYSCIC